MKHKWTEENARKYIERVDKKREPLGLKYLSAKDFLVNHKVLSKYSIIGI